MTSRERLMAAMRCQEPDTLPIHVWGVRPWNETWVEACDPSYKPVIEIAAQYGDYMHRWGPPVSALCTASEDVSYSSEEHEDGDWTLTTYITHTPKGALRASYRTSSRGVPGMQLEYPVKEPADVEKVLSIPYVPPQPDCAEFFEREQKIGDRGLVKAYLPDPVDYLHALLGSEQLAMWSILHRDLILDLLEVFTERLVELVKYMLVQGVGPVYGLAGEEYITPPLHGPKDFRDFVTAFEPRITRPVIDAGGLWHCHCHGRVGDILEDFVTIGINCLHPIEAPPMGNVTLADAKRRLAGKICIEGGVQIGDIYSAPTEDIRRQVKQCIDTAAPGGGFILGITASPHSPTLNALTVKNYIAFVETAVEYGR